MADAGHLGTQFHEMTQSEFAKQPDVQFHGTVHGQIDPAGRGFHVGTKQAAEAAMYERLVIRTKKPTTSSTIGNRVDPDAIYRDNPKQIKNETRRQPGFIETLGHNLGGTPVYAHDPKVIPGRLTGAVEHNVRTDENANEMAQDSDFTKHGVTIPYQNEVEDKGSTSYIVPHRSDFKTHEDYLVEARAAGKSIPKRAMRGYKVPPGQGKLF